MEEEIQKTTQIILSTFWNGVSSSVSFFCTFLATSKSSSKRPACAHRRTQTQRHTNTLACCAPCGTRLYSLQSAAQWRLINSAHTHTWKLFNAFTVQISRPFANILRLTVTATLNTHTHTPFYICIAEDRHTHVCSNILKINMIEYGKWFTFWNACVCVCRQSFAGQKLLELS